MHLIIGGAYQGKTEYAVEILGVPRGGICVCDLSREPDLSAACISHLERFVLRCMRQGRDPLEELHRTELESKVLICEDISCGVVPIDPELRAWREATGRFLCALSREAAQVTRVFCGLPLALKGGGGAEEFFR